jgi:hypothetical protein
MTGSQKIPFPRLQAYLSKVILWHSETDTTISLFVHQAVKWLFDLLRNAVIAGVVKYLATKADSWLLKIVSDAAFFALLAYCLSYVQTWQLRLFHPWEPAQWARVLDIIVSLLIIGPLFYAIIVGVPTAIDEIARAQSR